MHVSTDRHQPAAPAATGSAQSRIIAVVAELVRELHPRRTLPEVKTASRLERDLGIDSLGRAELILRVERAFRTRLPERVIEAETVDDLIDALGEAAPDSGEPSAAERPPPILPPVAAADGAHTLIDVLEWHVSQHADRLHATLLQDDTSPLGALTYAELAHAARGLAKGMIEHGVAPGERVALMLPTSLDFLAAFYGVLYAGAVPVPIYPPMRMSQLEEHMRRQAGILRNAGARLLVTVPEALRLARLLRAQVESLAAVESVAGLAARSERALPPPPAEDATALIQYTSGSTGDPKGVVLNHANLLANIRAVGGAMDASSRDIFVSWLPLYHDMGLIGAWLGCLHFGAPLYLMSPLTFLMRPDSWLRAMHRYGATLSAAPNFGFELCLNKIDPDAIEGLDLSSLRMVANGAEPVSSHTLRRFTERFGPYGFKPTAMAPVYGLAENAVGLTFPPPGRSPIIDRIDREALMRRGQAVPADRGTPKPLELVACGRPIPDHEIRIVDEAGRELGERREGRLQFRGPSATAGYFRNEPQTRALIRDGWLESGDRAYVAGGDLFITGRNKDLIIRAGRNIYPQELEEAISGLAGIRKGGVVAFGSADPASATERVVVLAETRERDAAERERLHARAQEVATDILGAPPDEVVLAPPRSVPKTSSGKIRRSAARELYEQHRLGLPQRALWWQVVRLSLAGFASRLSRRGRRSGALLYAAWWWVVIGLGLVAGWAAVMGLPRLEWRWASVRAIARLALGLIGARPSVSGGERIPHGNAMLVFNHSSYLDSLVLAAILPREPAFIAKQELASQPLVGAALRRLQVAFVERFEPVGRLADADAVTEVARTGRVMVFFPEGTFTRRPGLAGFYLGAFKVASEAELPVFPGLIRGTRAMLRSEQWFPRRSRIEVEIGVAVMPRGKDFSAIVQLRDEVRAAIAARSTEPDLGDLTKPAAAQVAPAG